ncbi:hypothetical protein ACGFNF_12490 [Micromonospora sp. NPDC048868]|uniref:hypothetical protein n=1 Tax=Micromonospora sp. NPDC048868 TaxID=3364258 RepID=UPI00370F7ADB
MFDVSNLDAWGDDALLRTVQEFRGVGSESDQPDEDRFLVGVAALVRKRLERDELEGDRRPAFFFLHPSPPTIPKLRRRRHVPMLDSGLERVSGHLWFVNKVANDGTAVPFEDDDDDEAVFRLALHDCQVGEFPAIVFDCRLQEPELRYYPDGLAKPDSCRVVRISRTEIAIEEIFDVIDSLYRQALCTPDAQGRAGKIWKDAAKGWASSDAEDLVQVVVRNGLIGRFPTCFVNVEQSRATGRLDIEIEEPLPENRARYIKHAVLELKVLRGRNYKGTPVSDSYNREWVKKGVKQASEYRTERGARLAALCCFDMRPAPSGDACFAHVIDLASALDVNLRCWHLFSSSEAYRDYRVSAAVSESAS